MGDTVGKGWFFLLEAVSYILFRHALDFIATLMQNYVMCTAASAIIQIENAASSN